MSIASDRLGITPSLQTHVQTQDDIQLALSSLKRASTATVVIAGTRLLLAPHHSKTAVEAAKFLSEHQVEAHLAVPEAFWTEIKNLAENAGAATNPDGHIDQPVLPITGNGIDGITDNSSEKMPESVSHCGSTVVAATGFVAAKAANSVASTSKRIRRQK